MAEQLTVEEFAKSIKTKYPQYAKIPDAELTQRIIAKYPQYKDKIKAGSSAKPKPAGPPSKSLVDSRRAAAKSEFDANVPQSTIATRTREAAIGVLEPFTLESLSQTIQSAGRAGFDALLGKPQKAIEFAEDIVKAPAIPVVNLYEGFKEGNYDRAANAAGGFLSQTVPAVSGAVESVAGPVKLGPEIPKPDLASLRNKARQFAQNRVGASPFRTTEPIVKEQISKIENASEARTEATRKAAEETAKNKKTAAEQIESNRAGAQTGGAGEKGVPPPAARATAIDRSLKEGSQKLGERVKELDAKLREEANEKYATVRQAVGNDPGVPLSDLTQAAQHAEQNILKGSAENIRQFRDLARKSEEVQSGPHTNIGFDITPGSPLFQRLFEEGAIDTGGNITFDQLQGYSSEIGTKLAKGGLPGDIYQALKYLKDKIDTAKTAIADRNGAGATLKDADSFWSSYMDAFYDSDSAVAKVRESVGTVDPQFYADPFTKGKAGDVAIAKLKQLKTKHGADASAAADLAHNLRSANSELRDIQPPTAKPVVPPKRVTPKEVQSPAPVTADNIVASKKQKVRSTADTVGRMRTTTAWRTLTAPLRWGESYMLQRPAILEWISKPTEADIEAVGKLPEPERSTLVNNLRQIIDRENASSRRVNISPAVQRLIGQAGTVSGGVQNRREAMERLGRPVQ